MAAQGPCATGRGPCRESPRPAAPAAAAEGGACHSAARRRLCPKLAPLGLPLTDRSRASACAAAAAPETPTERRGLYGRIRPACQPPMPRPAGGRAGRRPKRHKNRGGPPARAGRGMAEASTGGPTLEAAEAKARAAIRMWTAAATERAWAAAAHALAACEYWRRGTGAAAEAAGACRDAAAEGAEGEGSAGVPGGQEAAAAAAAWMDAAAAAGNAANACGPLARRASGGRPGRAKAASEAPGQAT